MGKLFSDIVGQSTAVKILTAQFESDKISHAYIFIGDEGVGKDYLAKKFSKYLLCPNSKEDDCTNCVNFEKGVHPDYIYIDGRDGIKIEQVKAVIERINLTPSIGKRKILFISRAENLGIEAANSLLKTLEEPPLDSVIILTTISEKSLPQTIISRAQKIKLNSLKKEDIKKILKKKFSDEEINKVINYSEGNIEKILKLLEDPNNLKEKKEKFEDIEIIFNSQSTIEKFKVIEKYDKNKNLKEFFDLFCYSIYELLSFYIKGEEVKTVTVAKKYDIYELTRIALKTLKIYSNLEYNVNLKIAMEEIIIENNIRLS